MLTVALALLLAAAMVAVAGVLGWTVYKLAEVRRDKASADSVNRVIDHLNSLSHGVHRSHRRAERRLDKAEGDVRTANENDVSIQARLDSLAERVESANASADTAVATSTAVSDSITGLSDEARMTTERVGENLSRIAQVETDLTLANTEVGTLRTDLIEVRSLAEAAPDTATYATWTDMADRELRARSITLDGAGEGGVVDAEDVRARQYGLKSEAGGSAVSGYIRAAAAGGMQFVPDGQPVSELSATLGSSGIRWGINELRVAPDGALQYCQGSSCERVATKREPAPRDRGGNRAARDDPAPPPGGG
jgi:uncharacterized protein YoxC